MEVDPELMSALDTDCEPTSPLFSPKNNQTLCITPVNKSPLSLSSSSMIIAQQQPLQQRLQSALILDTNFIINHLKFLSQLILILKEQSDVQMIIPFVVLKELDKLKLTLKDLAQQANVFLYRALQSKLNCIRGQTLQESLNLEESQLAMNADDYILDCCLYWQQHYAQHVFLLTGGISFLLLSFYNIYIYIYKNKE